MINPKIAIVFAVVWLTGCASFTPDNKPYTVDASRVAYGPAEQAQENATPKSDGTGVDHNDKGFVPLRSLSRKDNALSQQQELANRFSDTQTHKVAVDSLPMKVWLNQVFSDLLHVNFVIGQGIADIDKPVVLNLSDAISERKLFKLTQRLLAERGADIRFNDGIYYIYPRPTKGQGDFTVGVGRSAADVPDVVGNVMQIIPLRYGVNINIERTLRNLAGVQIQADYQQSVVFATGERGQVLKVLDLVNLMDIPANRGKHIGLLYLTYVSAEDFSAQVSNLLQTEGVPVDVGKNGQKNLVLVPLDQIGAIAVFASDENLLERVRYWAQQLDKPSKGEEKRYFIYHPQYARATDLGESISPLIGNASSQGAQRGNQNRDTRSAVSGSSSSSSSTSANNSTASNSSSSSNNQKTVSVSGDNISMTVDQRSNSIIFYTTGQRYQALLPMVKRLDVMPKQILLEATIAEVTLTDEFAQGFEFAVQNGNFGYGTFGNLGVADISGFNISYLGNAQIRARLLETNSLVNVLSNPTLVVRDGVQASISVGTDLPTVAATTEFNDKSTTSVEYRKTGLNLSVTPSINAQGLVVMQIQNDISNQTEGSSISGSPAIFERSLQTEVIAHSGQTILLGGLISQNDNSSDSKVPLLGDLPLIGNLFKGKKKSNTKTELVILITPKVIEQDSDWDRIKQRLQQGMDNLRIK